LQAYRALETLLENGKVRAVLGDISSPTSWRWARFVQKVRTVLP
jgi:hypothetical protein